jgi:putative inorganic carbon (HCO3(-)) transporter
LSYSAIHPLGGGFMCYLINHVEVLPRDGEPGYLQIGRSFHSVYFELLGEQGYPGLAMFLVTAGMAMFRLGRSAKRARVHPELHWVAGLSEALQSGLAVFLASGAFVGIAFQPMCWYFIALSISVHAYLWRVEHQQTAPTTGWRARTAATGWRNRSAEPTLPASPGP